MRATLAVIVKAFSVGAVNKRGHRAGAPALQETSALAAAAVSIPAKV